MLRKVAAVLATATLAACGSGDAPAGPEAVPLSLRLHADTVRPGGVLLVSVVGGRAAQDSIAGTIGGLAVTLARVTDSSLVLVVPEAPAGESTLAVDLAGDTARAVVTLLPAIAIDDPHAYLNAALDAQLTIVPAIAPTGITADDWGAKRARLDSLVQEAKTQVAALPAEDQLALARLLASLAPPAEDAAAGSLTPAARLSGVGMAPMAAANMTAAANMLEWRDPTCRNAIRRFLGAGFPALYSAGSLAFFLMAPIPNPLIKGAGAVASAAAFAGTMLVALDRHVEMVAACGVQKTTDLSEDPFESDASLAAARSTVRTAATTRRFFQGRGVTYYPVGTFRPLSNEEIGKDADVSDIADLIDGMHEKVAKVLSLAPSFVASKIPAPPRRLSQTPPGAATARAVPGTGVRIENVRPASVQLTSSPADLSVTLTSGAAVTDDVPFTYDVVSTYDPTVRKTMSGVARPHMSATVLPYPTTVTGDRTVTTDGNGNRVGTLTCGGSVTVRVKGGDTGEWGTFGWTMSGPETISETTPLSSVDQPAIFEAGDHPFSGSWYYAWTENGEAVFKPFAVTVSITYTDRLTGQAKTVPAITFNCT
jgi:hypothetical protein